MATLRDDRYAEVLAIVRGRVDNDHWRIQEMIDVRDRYNGDYVVPIPDVEGQDSLPAPVPYLIVEGIDQNAMRAASVMPYIEVPSVATSTGRTSDTNREYAAIRRRAHYARWDYSALDLMLYRGFRHMIGYGSMALGAIPDFKDGRARIVLRDPLSAYPEDRDPEDVRAPENAAFVYGKSRSWLRKNYPEARFVLDQYVPPGGTDDLWDVFEWQDADETIIGILGPRHMSVRALGTSAGSEPVLHMPLRRWPNRAGICTYYIPQRVTLNRVMSQVAKMIPHSDLWAKLMALDVVAAEKSIFTDKYALGSDNMIPSIVSGDGTWKDGRTGEINVLQNVRAVGALNDGPGSAAQPVIDRVERAVRINTGALAAFSGEHDSSMRTGRGHDTATSFAIDPRIQECHTIAKYALKAINRAGQAVEEGYWPAKSFRVFSGWPSDRGILTYKPSQHFQTEDGGNENAVSYAIAGADLAQTSVQVGQLKGSGLMSSATAMRMHPSIPDADAEQTQMDAERLRDAVAVGFAQQTAAGGVSLANAARIAKDLLNGMDVLDAIVAEDARQREEMAAQQQAQQDAGGAGPGGPVPGGPSVGIQPETDAAAAQAGAAASPMLASIPPPSTSQDRLRQLAAALRASA